MKQRKQRLKTIAWAFRIAWSIDHWTMLLWFLVCGALAILPAVALQFNRDTLSVISGFLSGAPYTYADAVKPIVKLGLLMIAIGLSARVNSQFVRMMTYDSYFGGMYAYIMEHAAWRKTSVRVTVGTASLRSRSFSRLPGPTEGS